MTEEEREAFLKEEREKQEQLQQQKQQQKQQQQLLSPNSENSTHNLGTPWSEEEKEALRKGVAEFGKEWAKIVETYKEVFAVNARTNRNLMDKWRNMETVRMNKVGHRSPMKKRSREKGNEITVCENLMSMIIQVYEESVQSNYPLKNFFSQGVKNKSPKVVFRFSQFDRFCSVVNFFQRLK